MVQLHCLQVHDVTRLTMTLITLYFPSLQEVLLVQELQGGQGLHEALGLQIGQLVLTFLEVQLGQVVLLALLKKKKSNGNHST